MTRLRLLRRLLGMWRDPMKPPRPSSDPELAEERLRATRILARSDQVLTKRARLDAALDHAVDVIRAPER